MACRIACDEFGPLAHGLEPADPDELRAAGWRLRPIPLGRKYRSQWNLWHAFREFAQNALDETEGLDITVERCAGLPPVTMIRDEGKGFGIQALLMEEQKGEDERAKHCLRGHFGEGMKLGVVAAMRAGARVLIRTVGMDVTWQAVTYEEIEGVFPFTRPNQNRDGTCIAIEGLDAERFTFPEAVDMPVDLRRWLAPILADLRPDLILHTVRGGPGPHDACKVRQVYNLPGSFYVRDIFVETQMPAIFGYNLWFDDTSQALDPNRDRLAVGATSVLMDREFAVLLPSMPPSVLNRLVASLLIRGDDDGATKSRKRANFEWRSLESHDLTELGQEFATRLHGTVVDLVGSANFSVAEEDAERKVLEHAAVLNLHDKLPGTFFTAFARAGLMKTADQIGHSVSVDTIPLSPKLVAEFVRRTAELQQSVHTANVLRAFTLVQDRFLALGRNLGEPAAEAVYFYVGSGADEEAKWGGFWKRPIIHIRISQINKGVAIGTLVHEAAHAESGARDLTDPFEHALVRVGLELIKIVRGRRVWYDRLVANLDTLRDTTLRFYPVTGRFAVDRTAQTERMTLPEALDKYGYLFFGEPASVQLRGHAGVSGLAAEALSSWR